MHVCYNAYMNHPKQCETCGLEFVRAIDARRWEKRRFCSYKCRAVAMPPPVQGVPIIGKSCERCDKPFKAKSNAVLKSRRFCSSTCASQAIAGAKHWNWKGGKTPQNHLIRKSPQYNSWRKAVYARDRWTCQMCNVKQKQPIAHHIKSFNDYPELRFEIDNGMTLCRACHKKVHAEIGLTTRFAA